MEVKSSDVVSFSPGYAAGKVNISSWLRIMYLYLVILIVV